MKHFSPFGALVLGAALLTAPLAASAQMTITQARAAALNSIVTFRGTVSNGPELGVIRYVQDNAAGLAVYSAQLAALVPGDSVEITGKLVNYNGLMEISPVNNFTVLAQNRPLTVAEFTMATAPTAFTEPYESRLVRLNANTSITTTAGAPVTVFTGNANYQLNGNPVEQMRVSNTSTGPNGIVGKPAPSTAFDLLGIMSQYVFNGTSSSTTGYQLLARNYDDFVLGNAPNLLTAPMPTAISQTSLTVSFTTQNAGDTRFSYGTSPTSLTLTTNDPTQGTSHSATLPNLLPATVYYVQASSTNGIGTSTSPVVAMITESQSSGRIWAHFTNPVDNSFAYPATNLAVSLPGLIDDTLVTYMNRAQQTLDIAIYNWNNITLLNGINAAFRRGVRVRIVIDGNASGNSTAGLDPGIPLVARAPVAGGPSPIMHNKFVIIDADAVNPTAPLVWAGATNWTTGQLGVDRNSAIIVQDQSLARVYTMEFNEMWGSATATPGTPKFGAEKADNTPHFLKIGGRAVESWFSPSDNVTGHLIETINTADNDLHFATMLMTRSEIAQAIRNRVQLMNISQCSEGLVNDTVQAGGTFRTVRQALGTRYQKYNGPGIMHHKYLLVDAGGSDPITWVGSHNWSAAANTGNDENTLVIHDAAITNQHYQEFAKRIQDQNAGIGLCQLRILGVANDLAGSTRLAATVYPNPTSGQFRVESAAVLRGAVEVELLDANGRRVLRTTTTAGADHSISLDADALPTGLYHLRVTSAAGTQLGRVSVVK